MMQCQSCGRQKLTKILSLGYMPPVNLMQPVGEEAQPETWLPTDLLYCSGCELVQLGCIADADVVFPASYPYTSGSTRILCDNFADLRRKAQPYLKTDDLVVDIGSNDGTLLENFSGKYKILGVEPTDVAKIASARGIPTLQRFFDLATGHSIKNTHGQAKLVTACNVFAHIDDVHGAIDGILEMLAPDGVFISESHYLFGLIDRLQYDTIYHEHLRYYSVNSLRHLLAAHGLHIVNVERIPTHGGSIRVYASRTARQRDTIVEPTGADMLALLDRFAADVAIAKRVLLDKILNIKRAGKRIAGIGAPSRASTVVSYCRLDHTMIDYVCEIEGSLKIGRYMPGTSIPVVHECRLLDEQPEHAIIFSWHIADEIMYSLRAKGYRGKFIMPIEAPPQMTREEWLDAKTA